jgi:CspA family cold shock protein
MLGETALAALRRCGRSAWEVGVPLGRVKWFNEIKGTGVIRRLEGGDFPVHFGQILDDGFRTLFEGEVVGFEISSGRGGPEAVRVRRLHESLSRDATVIPQTRETRPEGNSHV